MHMQVCAEARGGQETFFLIDFFFCSPAYLLRQDLFLNWELTSELDWLASKLLGCPTPPAGLEL